MSSPTRNKTLIHWRGVLVGLNLCRADYQLRRQQVRGSGVVWTRPALNSSLGHAAPCCGPGNSRPVVTTINFGGPCLSEGLLAIATILSTVARSERSTNSVLEGNSWLSTSFGSPNRATTTFTLGNLRRIRRT